MVQNKVINGNTYYARPMPPLEALKLLGDLQKVITTSLQIDGEDKGIDSKIDVGTIISNIGGRLDGVTLVGFAERILNPEYVSVQMADGVETLRLDKLTQTKIFTGKIKDMISVMFFVLEVNFKDFFDLAQSDFGNITAALRK